MSTQSMSIAPPPPHDVRCCDLPPLRSLCRDEFCSSAIGAAAGASLPLSPLAAWNGERAAETLWTLWRVGWPYIFSPVDELTFIEQMI